MSTDKDPPQTTAVGRRTNGAGHALGALQRIWHKCEAMAFQDEVSDTHVTRSGTLKADVPRFLLRVGAGADAGLSLELDGASPQRALVGKSPVCDLTLTDPEVSRRHASLHVQGPELTLLDVGSTNGTFVDGIRVGKAFLRGGETISIGQTKLHVVALGSESREPVPQVDCFGDVLGVSQAMRRLYPLCERLAATEVSAIIEGETGTGKEQLARAIHDASSRSEQPFVVFDCTAVAPTLIESELFGHERGAFTGSVRARHGVFERAHGGTLFIDELGDLPFESQAKLLRAVERNEITRVGGNQVVKFDVRILAATRRDLDALVAAGQFRDDLYHRLAVLRVELPPLRERRGDIRLLALHFWRALGGADGDLPTATLRIWESDPWPGNVRGLRNAVLRRWALGDAADEYTLSTGSVPPPPPPVDLASPAAPRGDVIARVLGEALPIADARQRVIGEFEARYTAHLLEQYDDNVDRAAAAAGVAPRHFYRLKAKALAARRQEPD